MRSEAEMKALILAAAGRDEVRAVFLNGSRANPNAPRDRFQDFDIVFAVTELAPFLREPDWISVLGKELIFQFPDDSLLFPHEPPRSRYGCLMQFADGNRIDLTLLPLRELSGYLQEDSETLLWLDKDGEIPPLPPASDRDYWVKPPSAAEFAACCNEFYWVSLYPAKGLCRNELPYALEMLNRPLRDVLLQMLCWRAGMLTAWSVSTGKCGKYLEKFLPPAEYAALLDTYCGGEAPAIWAALFAAYRLFEQTARAVGGASGFEFPEAWARDVPAYAAKLRAGGDAPLPPAAEIG